ncbi:hypothetical protein C8240_12110, partial [Paracidovorax cattleyae]
FAVDGGDRCGHQPALGIDGWPCGQRGAAGACGHGGRDFQHHAGGGGGRGAGGGGGGRRAGGADPGPAARRRAGASGGAIAGGGAAGGCDGPGAGGGPARAGGGLRSGVRAAGAGAGGVVTAVTALAVWACLGRGGLRQEGSAPAEGGRETGAGEGNRTLV